MLKWLSGEEGAPGSAQGPGSPSAAAGGGGGEVAVEEMAERLGQTELLVAQLKELIREKDAALSAKEDQLKVEKETCESKLSKLRLQNKAKVTSLTSQLEELRKQQGGQGTPTRGKKGSSEAEHASRGKIVLLKKKVEELEQQLAQRQEDLDHKRKEVESQRQRGEEMDAMLTERDRKLAEKEAYIVHLQTALAGDQPAAPPPQIKEAEDGAAMQELQLLVQSLTRKVGEAEERYSLLQEQAESLKELVASEKEQYLQKESMYKQNIQTFKDIIIQKDSQLTEISQMHEQELFKLAAKSDASADLEQLLKALKQKLHEKEEVLLGKTQVIDVLQGEVDGRDQQIQELVERLRRLHVERESLASRMEAEKHVMRAQLRDLMEKQQAEVQRLTEQHRALMDQAQRDLQVQPEEPRSPSGRAPTPSREAEPGAAHRTEELEARAKQKTEEARRAEDKFLKMKAWSKTRIRQLEEELRKSQGGGAPPDLTALRSRVTALEEEREENIWKVEQYEELKTKNERLEAKLEVYEEQQRTLQADLEQFTKRAASQASESGSADEAQSQVLEWQEMVGEAVSARDRAKEEQAAMALRISHMEEEREALATRQRELEEELTQARGLGHPPRAKAPPPPAQRSLQDDFEFDGQASFQDPRSPSESTTPMEGENMGGWWPEYSAPDTDGLRSVVEELELERNQLQEQILSLEEHCQHLEDRQQLQARIEALQNESERLQSQLAAVRTQQSRDAENHQLLVASLNEQLKGLSSTQECLESSLIEKENTLAKTSEKLELISSLRESLSEKEAECREASDKLLQAEHALEDVSVKCSSSEKQCSELRAEVVDLAQKLSALKEKTQKQEVTVDTLQAELDQTNEELDKLNSAHLEERAQLIHDLQGCEREIDRLKDVLLEKEEEIQTLSGNMAEYAEQVTVLKQEVKLKEENLVRVESALSKAEREAAVVRESQTSDQQALDSKITQLVEKVKDAEAELLKSKEEREAKEAEAERLREQTEEDRRAILDLRGEVQQQLVSHRSQLSEREAHVAALKEQLTVSTQKLQELLLQLKDRSTSSEQLQQQLRDKEQTYERELKSFKDEKNGLLAQVEKYSSEMQMLSKRLEEQTQSEEHMRRAIQEKQETIETLEGRLKTTDKQAEDERQKFNDHLKDRDSENEKLSSELLNKSENVSKLKNVLKSIKTEKKQLQEKLQGLTEELEQQKQRVDRLTEKIAAAQELNRSLVEQVDVLTEEKARLQREAAAGLESVGGVALQRDALETQLSQNRAAIQELESDKERLTLLLEQSSQTLLAKTTECTNLEQQVRSLSAEAEQLQHHHRSQMEAQQKQQTELQEALCLLREQEGRLRSELQSEVTLQKNIVIQLEAEAASLTEERSQLRLLLREREDALSSAARHSQTHKEEVDAANDAAKSLSERIRLLEDEGAKREAEAERMRAEHVGLNAHVQALTEQNHQLRAACESTRKELSLQSVARAQLDAQLRDALEQNADLSLKISSLTQSNAKSLSELAADRSLLQEQNSENQKVIGGLLEEKEKLLQEREEQVGGLRLSLDEKQTELLHLQDTASMLQQQGSVLKAALQQKAEELEALLSQKQSEVETVRRETDAVQEQKEQTVKALREEFEKQKEELSRRSESVFSLSAQLAAMNQSAADTEAAVQRLEAQNAQLTQSEERSKAETAHLNDGLRALREQNASLQSKLQEAVTEISAARREAERLHASVSEGEDKLLNAGLEKQRLCLMVQTKDESLQQHETLIQHLNVRITEQEETLQQKDLHNATLTATVSELEDSTCGLRGQVDRLSSESSLLRNSLEKKEQLILEYQSDSSAAVEDLRCKLQAKEAECEGLKEHTSHLEESLTKLSSSLHAHTSEAQSLKQALQEKEAALLDQSKSLGDIQRRADEAALLEARSRESTEMVSQLQSKLQLLSAECEQLRTSAGETQSAFNNLQEKYAADLEELQEARKQLSQSTEEVSSLQRLLDDAGAERQTARTTIETLRDESSRLHHKVQEAQDLSTQKDEALASHQASVSLLTAETEGLKAQHLQVVAQMNALTENLEQREMALHAINSQYTSQAKHTSQLVSQMQKLEQQNKRLNEEKQEHQKRLKAAANENTRLQEEVRKHLAEREELERRYHQVQGELQVQVQQQSSSLSQIMEQTMSEKERLQAKVSAGDREVSLLKENIEKIEQILQDSEKEWLLVLDREKQDKDLLAEQLKSVENEMKSKDVKVSALKADLDVLQQTLAEASSAIRQGSDQLSAKEAEAAASRVQLEKVLESVRQKDKDNSHLQQALKAAEQELHKLVGRKAGGDKECERPAASLLDMIQQLEESHRAELEALEDRQAALLKEKADLQTRLDAEEESVKEAADKHSSLQAKDEQIGCLSAQIAGLSQQLRERDASIGHLMEAASTERMKLGEETRSLTARLESTEEELQASRRRFEEVSQQLEERLRGSLGEIESKNCEKLELISKNDDLKSELAKVSKERDAAKKKLQAALLVRKDLMKRIEHNDKSEQEKLEEAKVSAEMYQENISLLEKKILYLTTESQSLVEQWQSEKHLLQAALSEREQSSSEQRSVVEQLQSRAAEAEEAYQRDRAAWELKSQELQKELRTCREEPEDAASSTASAVHLEKELAQMKLEKAKVQKKAQAALLARKETLKKAQENEKKLSQELAELKDDYKALLQQRCQQTNELNALQLDLGQKVTELEELRLRSLSDLDELATLRQLVEERDRTLQGVKMSLAEKESQCHSLAHLQTELEDVKSKFESSSLEVASGNEALVAAERRADALESKLQMVEKDLEKAHADLKERAEQVERHQEAFEAAELKTQLEKEDLWNQLRVSLEQVHKNEDKYQLLMEQNQALLEKGAQMKVELEALTSQKAAETQQQLRDQSAAAEELEKAQLLCSETQTKLDLLKQEKENASRLVAELRAEVTALNEERHKQEVKEEPCSSSSSHDALSASQAPPSETEEMIPAPQPQSQHPLQVHESEVEKMRTQAELQRSPDGGSKAQESKVCLLTRKLQAALVSRKELLRENATLKEAAETLSAQHELSLLKLKHQNAALQSDNEQLGSRAAGASADNRSLKLTIENITQQKQAFSCQLESLKDSQTEELSKWRVKHAELKRECESLLEAYENTKRERQEALQKVHQCETEMEILDRRARETEEDNGRIKERMHRFSKEKRQKIEELEEENLKIRGGLIELEENHKLATRALTDEGLRLRAEICRLEEKLNEFQAEKERLAAELEEASRSHSESKTYTNAMQLKLDEALGLNRSLTAQIETQKSELAAQMEVDVLLQKEKQDLCERLEKMQSDHELQLGKSAEDVDELKDAIDQLTRGSAGLSEKVTVLEDDRRLLQEELESLQGILKNVKNENEHLETVILRNSETIEELGESVCVLQASSEQLSSQLAASQEASGRVRQEKEEEQLKLVREFEKKLEAVQRGSEGSKNVKKELQELLREKHLEINHLQQNCIRYQEVILDLESAVKSSRSATVHLESELRKSSQQASASEERSKLVEAELMRHKDLLQEATKKIQNAESERDQLALDISQGTKTPEDNETPESSSHRDEKQSNSYLENQLMLQQQIEDLKDLKDKESQKVEELKQNLDAQDLQINTLKRSAVTNEAKLSAVSASPLGADASKRWSHLYQKTLHEKDSQLLEQGFVIKRFLEDMRVKDKEVSELRVTKSRLERTLSEYSVAAAAQQRQLLVLGANNAELSEAVELLGAQVKELGAHARRMEHDKNALNGQLADKEDLISRVQLNLQQVEKTNADSEAQLFLSQALRDKVQADFEKQEGISLQLKTLLHSKDAEISSLLSCRDGQMSGYLEQLQANHRAQLAVYEDRLASSRYQREKADKELRGLEAKVKSLQGKVNTSIQEKDQAAAKMESFKNSMVSLQSERERLTSECRMLEAKTRLGLKGRDGSADGEGGATKGLKHEIRKLLHQMDDLNSENAMLRAQLVRYREDLNQVLFLKDNQLKVLLKKQTQVIKDLENQNAAAEKQHTESRAELLKEEEAHNVLRAEASELKAQLVSVEADLLALKQQRGSTDEGKVIADLQEAVAAKAAECNDLRQKLHSQRVQTGELRDRMQRLESETDQKLSEAEDKYNGELDASEREAALMRTEREAADLRAADLAKELLEAGRRLSDARAQHGSMSGAMAALQNDRDQLIQDFKVLRDGYDAELREARAAAHKAERGLRGAAADRAALAAEREVLVRKAAALESGDAPAALSALLDQLSKELAEKERALKAAALDNEALSKQLSAFSGSMASLQSERERLMEQLAGARREGEGPEPKKKMDDVHQQQNRETSGHQRGAGDVRCETQRKDEADEAVRLLEEERTRLHGDLRRCLYEIQQRDQYAQQLDLKLQQEKGAAAAQMRDVSQTLRDAQDRCRWLENQVQSQGAVSAEVAPGAPQERSDDPSMASQLRERLLELEQSLTEERARREAAEEALQLTEGGAKRDFSIEMEAEEEWDAGSLDPSQPLITRKVRGGAAAFRRWIRGRSLYFSRLLTGRARSRYFFLCYLLAVHLLVLLCLTGAL
ncbi:golgin subfamily B member 1-like isoform X3 [Pungitius pungitius]|uniref:golgin subfamily B member 1-like isoform X3 n=1 Tax=Pungitius pungitius TaxID=134920 RepID=UPI002E0F6C10